MANKKKLIIVGGGNFGQIAFEYFTYDSGYQVSGFAVEAPFRKQDTLFGLPVVDFENIESHFSNQDYEIFIAVVFTELNRIRTRLYLESKNKGYKIASYVSSKAFCWRNVRLGENVFIFEDNTVQPFVEIGNNVILWSGNHIGHHSTIDDNCFISSHVVISGNCNIGKNCFIGVNAAIADGTVIADDCFIGMGAVINKDTESDKVYIGNPAVASSISATRLTKVGR
jgi:sugar O-acyltransferase (sialic acid O-acetyltransferase NeuD family)